MIKKKVQVYKKLLPIIILLLLGAVLFYWMAPRDFRKMYNEDDDLIDTFFLLYKTENQKIKDIVNESKKYDMRYKVDLVGGDLRQLFFKDGNFSYAYTVYPKGDRIYLVVSNKTLETNSQVLSGEILHEDKLSTERFAPEIADNHPQTYFEEQAIENLQKIFQVIYDEF